MTDLDPLTQLSSPSTARRAVLLGGLAGAAAAGFAPNGAHAATDRRSGAAQRPAGGPQRASFVTTRDGTEIFYKDWGKGPAIIFSHGWPLNADVWDDQMMFMAARGFRCIAF